MGEEPVSGKLIGVVILLVGFAILLFFLYRNAFPDQIDRSTCHLSVVERGSLPDTISVKDLPPLKCGTRKVCITDKLIGKGDCEKELGSTFDTIRVSSDKIKMQEDINKIVAQEQADCWSMMGEGNIQVFTRGALNNNRCVVCSRISFDNTVTEKNKEIEGIGKYMITNNVPNQNISYWNFTSGGIVPANYSASNDKFTTTEKAVLFIEADKTAALRMFQSSTGVIAGCIAGAKAGAIGGAIIGGLASAGVASPVSGAAGGVLGCIGGGFAGGFVGEQSSEEMESWFGASPYLSGNFLIDYNSEGFKNQSCDSLESVP